MKVSKLFTKTSKNWPTDETANNAKLLIQAGFIHKEMAGVYAYLPLGKRVLDKISQIIREEMNSLGAQELIMTSLQSKELWQKTGRWDDKAVDIWFKSKLKSGQDVGLAWSHEEQISAMMKEYISSYRDLPAYVYQFQNKLRNELRAKSGIMRTREFLMKDLYSYSKSEAEHQQFYDAVTQAYLRIFEKVGLGESTFLTFASGGAFTKFSHEFQTVTANGEDTIYLDRAKQIAINEEVMNDDVLSQVGLKREGLEKVMAAEVGNIFSFGGGKSEQLGLHFTDEDGSTKPVILGSYGIGIGRLMGVIVEHFADEYGIIWPESVAPFRVCLVSLGDEEAIIGAADELYSKITDAGVEILYDDRHDTHAGAKLADADLIGIPYRVVVSSKTLASGQYELKKRAAKEIDLLSAEELLKKVGIDT